MRAKSLGLTVAKKLDRYAIRSGGGRPGHVRIGRSGGGVLGSNRGGRDTTTAR